MESGLDEGLLSESQGLFRIVLENMLDPVFVTDDGGRFTFICANTLAVLGYTVEEIAAAGTMTRFLGRELFSAAELEAGRELANIECPIAKKDGTKRDFLVTVKRVSIGRGTVLYVCRDVTERKRVEEALRESEEQVRQLFESVPQLVWTCQPEGLCDYLGPQWVKYTGVPEVPQLGYGWLEQVHPDDRELTLASWLSKCAAGSDFHVEFRIRRHDGVYRWFDTHAKLMRDLSGYPTKWFGSNTDITERKRAEEALQGSQKRFQALVETTSDFV